MRGARQLLKSPMVNVTEWKITWEQGSMSESSCQGDQTKFGKYIWCVLININ